MNKTVLVTGASGKIGKVIVNHLLHSNYYVIAQVRSLDKVETLPKINNNCLSLIVLDFDKDDFISSLLNQLGDLQVYPEYLINNARSIESLKCDKNGICSTESLYREFKFAVIIPYLLTTTLAFLENTKLKNVINIGSQYGSVASNLELYNNNLSRAPLQYGVAKAAQNHLTKELAVRLIRQGIRVNSLSLGGIEGRVDDDFKSRYSKLSPIGRMLHENEFLGAIDFLLSDNCFPCIGHNLVVDGGWTLW